jgi:hypothetical protein
MWTPQIHDLEHGRAQRIVIERDGAPLRYAEVVSLWREEPPFCSFFVDVLTEVPYGAYRWETPAVTATTADQPFECVVLASPALERRPNSKAFAAHFADAVHDIATFSNLGGDAVLIVPTPVGSAAAYGHLAAFMRDGPDAQRMTLWRRAGEAMRERMGTRRVWLSTAGMGVPWLHVRLDDTPKYYGHAPYRIRP